MLNRQRAFLYFVHLAGGEVSLLHLTKWCFLLCEESASRGGNAFYEFVPYKLGPYSFCLHQEGRALSEQGYLKPLSSGSSVWTITDLGKCAANALPDSVARDARAIFWKFGKRTTEELLDDVYARYPWFTIHSQRQRLSERPHGVPAVYTAGYEGNSVDGFLNRLLKAGIDRLIDVRNNPVSRRYGFHKSTLGKLCSHLGMDYAHVPELGIRSENRQNLECQSDYDALFAVYRRTTLNDESAATERVAALVREKASVLVCMEAEPCQCHRSHLAEAVAVRAGLRINHLKAV